MNIYIANPKTFKIGYYVSLFGTCIVLFWIGVFKFTPTEARLIEPLVANHPLMSWGYKFLTPQFISNFIGMIEIIISLLLIIGIFNKKAKFFASIGTIITFIMTISFLFTTPDVWKVKDAVPITDFFILKDIVFLGFGLMMMGISFRR